MEDHGTFDDYPIISSLKDHGLFHVIRPEENVGANETKELAEALVEIVASGRLDHLKDTNALALGLCQCRGSDFMATQNSLTSSCKNLKLVVLHVVLWSRPYTPDSDY